MSVRTVVQLHGLVDVLIVLFSVLSSIYCSYTFWSFCGSYDLAKPLLPTVFEAVVEVEAAVEVSKPLSMCQGCCRTVKAAVKVLRPRCQGRC